MKYPKILVAVSASGLILLQGCAGLVVGAGVGAVSVAHDNRTVGTQLDDKTTTTRISTALAENEAIKNQTNVSVRVFNGSALLLGQAPTQPLIQQIGSIASGITHVKKVHNQVRIGVPIPPSVKAQDAWIASKVKTQLIADKRIDGLNVKVEVENGEVFLMGLITQTEANLAVEVTRHVKGVKQVIKAFEYAD
jgi:osmotically-inducible protein OsmY